MRTRTEGGPPVVLATERTGSAGRPARGAGRRTLTKLARPAIGIAAFFVACEIVTRLEFVNPRFLPPASTIVARFFGLFGKGGFRESVVATLESWAIGVGIAAAVGISVGIVLGSSQVAYRLSRPVIELIRPIPAIAMIPLAILLFGQGLEMKVWLIAFAAVWPILYNTLYAVHDVDPLARDTARVFGYGRVAILRRVALPSAAPFMMTGLRIAVSIGLVVGISAELLSGAGDGIGTWILLRSFVPGSADLVFAAAVFAAMLGFLANLVLESLEQHAFRWSHANRGSAR